MRKLLFLLSFAGLFAGCVVAYLAGITQPPLAPAFSPPVNPYSKGIYAEGIIESDQPSGENINLYPEVSGTVKQILVNEGQPVKKGQALLQIDDSIQRGVVEQQEFQAQAAQALLEELRAQPRKENLEVSKAQVAAAEATLKTAQDSLLKQENAYQLNPRSVSRDALDSAANTVAVAKANLDVARRQLELTQAGAWTYDIRNQEKQYNAIIKAHASSSALLAKYTLRAPHDGVVLTITSAVGSFVSPQGGYETYTGGQNPVLILGSSQSSLNVRCYVDEILVSRLPSGTAMKAVMTVRGSGSKASLTFVRVQPFVSPKIELSNQRTERVDVRVLPVIFHIDKPKDLKVYPGELVDVYISE